jgi:hypothetical protein
MNKNKPKSYNSTENVTESLGTALEISSKGEKQ